MGGISRIARQQSDVVTMMPESLIAVLTTIGCGYIDARTGFIPNRITYPALAITLTFALFFGSFSQASIGMLCVGGTLAFLYIITRKRGLGLGDVKLGACIGAGLGPANGMLALGSSFILGGIIGALLLACGHAGRKDAVRFGPFLAFGTLFSFIISEYHLS
jgi:leader peptidase (prepilin peptidase) / N-methyltransferase